ncbi:protein kinase [Planctomycetota bacterium]
MSTSKGTGGWPPPQGGKAGPPGHGAYGSGAAPGWPSGSGAYPQQPGSGAYPQQPGSGAYPQQPGSGAYPQQPGSGAYPQQSGYQPHPSQAGAPYQQYPSSHGYGSQAVPYSGAAAPPSPPSAPRTPEPGQEQVTRFGRYELRKELGRGGMGIVYEAFQAELKRRCALKVLQGHEGERLVHEGQACAKLKKHPNIVQIFDAGMVDGTAYIAMEYVKGTPLDELLEKKGPLPEDQLLEIGYKVALALHHAHRHGIVHRDMKPANVILDEDGEPHVLDFGLAKDLVVGDTQFAGLIVGTPSYMPPEQLSPTGAGVDGRADVYSLGATLYHLASAKPPFDGAVTEIMYRLVSEEPPALRSLTKISADLDAVIGAAMEKDPELRYQSSLEFADDLSRVISGEPPKARRLGPIGRALRRVQRHPALATLAVVLVLLTAAAGFFVARSRAEMDVIWEDLSRQVAAQTANEVRSLLEPGLPIIEELCLTARLGLLPIDDFDALNDQLAARLRFRKNLSWLSYGEEASGLYAGAFWSNDGVLTAHRAWPKELGGKFVEAPILEDLSRGEKNEGATSYDPRKRGWYELAVASEGPAWTAPYKWTGDEGAEGSAALTGYGITCTAAVRDGETVRGAFTADYHLHTISDFLRRITKWPGCLSFLMTVDEVVVASSTPGGLKDSPALVAAVRSLPRTIADLEPEVPISLEYEVNGVAYTAAFELFRVAGGLEWATAIVAPVDEFRGGADRGAVWTLRIAIAGVVALVFGSVGMLLNERRRARKRVRDIGRSKASEAGEHAT